MQGLALPAGQSMFETQPTQFPAPSHFIWLPGMHAVSGGSGVVTHAPPAHWTP
jgi:hypothetical protein